MNSNLSNDLKEYTKYLNELIQFQKFSKGFPTQSSRKNPCSYHRQTKAIIHSFMNSAFIKQLFHTSYYIW